MCKISLITRPGSNPRGVPAVVIGALTHYNNQPPERLAFTQFLQDLSRWMSLSSCQMRAHTEKKQKKGLGYAYKYFLSWFRDCLLEITFCAESIQPVIDRDQPWTLLGTPQKLMRSPSPFSPTTLVHVSTCLPFSSTTPSGIQLNWYL